MYVHKFAAMLRVDVKEMTLCDSFRAQHNKKRSDKFQIISPSCQTLFDFGEYLMIAPLEVGAPNDRWRAHRAPCLFVYPSAEAAN